MAESCFRVLRSSDDQIVQRINDEFQPRLGADKPWILFEHSIKEHENIFGGGSQLIHGFIAASFQKAAQPKFVGTTPVGQIGFRLRDKLVRIRLPQLFQIFGQRGQQI